jgi:hypothetical protein
MGLQITAQKLEIIAGATKEINVYLMKKSTSEPLDLTAATQIEAVFKKADDTLLTLNLSSGVSRVSDLGGKFKVTLTTTNSALLKLDERQDFEVAVTFASSKYIVQFKECLDVIQRMV